MHVRAQEFPDEEERSAGKEERGVSSGCLLLGEIAPESGWAQVRGRQDGAGRVFDDVAADLRLVLVQTNVLDAQDFRGISTASENEHSRGLGRSSDSGWLEPGHLAGQLDDHVQRRISLGGGCRRHGGDGSLGDRVIVSTSERSSRCRWIVVVRENIRLRTVHRRADRRLWDVNGIGAVQRDVEGIELVVLDQAGAFDEVDGDSGIGLVIGREDFVAGHGVLVVAAVVVEHRSLSLRRSSGSSCCRSGLLGEIPGSSRGDAAGAGHRSGREHLRLGFARAGHRGDHSRGQSGRRGETSVGLVQFRVLRVEVVDLTVVPVSFLVL